MARHREICFNSSAAEVSTTGVFTQVSNLETTRVNAHSEYIVIGSVQGGKTGAGTGLTYITYFDDGVYGTDLLMPYKEYLNLDDYLTYPIVQYLKGASWPGSPFDDNLYNLFTVYLDIV